MRTIMKIFSYVAIMSVALSCGQETVSFPEEDDCFAVCGSYYPGANAQDSGGESNAGYGFFEGDIFPCAQFDVVRSGNFASPHSRHLLMNDVFLSRRNGEVEALNKQFGRSSNASAPEFLVFVSAAMHCPECAHLIADIASNAQQIEDAGIAPVAVANRNLWDAEKGLGIEQSETLLENDGWPARWLRTNDPADVMTSSMSAWPTVYGVRLSDMIVITSGAAIRTAADLIGALNADK